MDSPLVSVIIPTYNRAGLILKAIRSVLCQDYTDFELLICDDGSTDNTEDVVRSVKDKRIKYLRQENKGCAAARNLGLKNSNGWLIAHLDSDDYWLPGHLSALVEFFNIYPKAGMAFTQKELVYLGCEPGEKKNYKKRDIPYEEKKEGFRLFKELIFDEYLFHGDLNAPSCSAVRREVYNDVGSYNKELICNQDYDMHLRISNRYKIGVIKKDTVYYLVHPGRISGNVKKEKYLKNRIKLYKNIMDKCRLSDIQTEYIRNIISEDEKEIQHIASS